MAYQIKINNFEGPFDLLFHLIKKAEVDIYDIPIADITNQYIEYISEMKNMDLDNASEFIVMAATLIQIKSKMLLPKETNPFDEIAADEMDPRAELIEKLLEYKRYKEVSETLKDMEQKTMGVFFKSAEIIDDIEENNLFIDITLDDIIKAFQDIITRCKDNKNIDDNETQILREEFTVTDKIKDIKNMIIKKQRIIFSELFINAKDKFDIILTFLALLELIRLREVNAHQDTTYGDIIITSI